MKINTMLPVMVTGSTGYVGGVLVQQLLEAGLTVHCPVRDPTNASKIQHLKNLKGGEERLQFFQADLMKKGSYLESMKGCSVVFHVASPFIMSAPKGKEQEMLLDPAIKGTLNVLESANDPSLNKSVKRVVVTSSVVAIATDGKDCADAREKTGAMINEDSFNESASIDYQPYAYSKVMAEKAAWKFVEDNNHPFELATCNPGFVMGPGIKVHESAESYTFVQGLGDGKLKYCPDMGLAVVDVRDVAKGHIAAGFGPSSKVNGQRFILNGANTSIMDMGAVLKKKFPNHPLPSSRIPYWIFWLVGPLLGIARKYISRSVGYKMELDGAKSLRDLETLGGAYVPLQTTMEEMFAQCVDVGYIASREEGKTVG